MTEGDGSRHRALTWISTLPSDNLAVRCLTLPPGALAVRCGRVLPYMHSVTKYARTHGGRLSDPTARAPGGGVLRFAV